MISNDEDASSLFKSRNVSQQADDYNNLFMKRIKRADDALPFKGLSSIKAYLEGRLGIVIHYVGQSVANRHSSVMVTLEYENPNSHIDFRDKVT